MYRLSRILTLLLVCSITMFMACEGPQGPEGPQGEQGPEGPVGPAGEDGSMMYSGSGAPDASTGETGDYYLDTDTGEMYGPKDDSGWGNPIIVLKGEDGEDGSQIHAGTGAPDASLGVLGDFYLDKANYDMYGPKTENGWGTPINLKGADGNANVTRYIYPGYDFSSNSINTLFINNMSQSEFNNNSFLVYLFIADNGTGNQGYYSIPGLGQYGNTYYRLNFYHTNGDVKFWLEKRSGDPGEQYDRIEIVSIKASSTEDNRKVKDAGVPENLDTSNYKAVAEYYGFYR